MRHRVDAYPAVCAVGAGAGQYPQPRRLIVKTIKSVIFLTAAGLLSISGVQAAGEHPMGFFVTSKGIGNGADLGGLAGAD